MILTLYNLKKTLSHFRKLWNEYKIYSVDEMPNNKYNFLNFFTSSSNDYIVVKIYLKSLSWPYTILNLFIAMYIKVSLIFLFTSNFLILKKILC